MGIVAFAVVEEWSWRTTPVAPVWQLGVVMQSPATRDVAGGRALVVHVVWLEGRGNDVTSI
jgi:hypothetical protein